MLCGIMHSVIISGKIEKELLVSPFAKAVADIKRRKVALGCELHRDCADELLADGANAKDLWGFNIYPDGRIDFISLINIRPADNNRTMEIQNEDTRAKIRSLVLEML